jgi:5-methylcytosine-specific restriction endonuclease McrBC GTP-binding regulatory subunit McrB
MLFGKSDENELNEAEEEIYKNNVEFVQFHPSYDYSDFVEGMRPITSDEGSTLGFERRDGVFKAFCERAISNTVTSGSDNFDTAWAAMVADIDENDYIDVPLISGKGMFRVELNQYGTGLANRTYPNNTYEKGQWIEGKSKFFNKEQVKKVYHGLNGVPGGAHDNYRRAIVDHMMKKYGLKAYEETTGVSEVKPYIFIIDEINRGELSKILGELFYSIDPGYRGVSGRVKTQYQNLIAADDTFSDGFYVPENVYILGTMNDIDRSVESMDFAIRRRFTWREILAVDTQEEMLQLLDESIREKAKKSMNALNEAILNPDYHLGEAYQIGASYFLKLQHDPNFDNLWKFHLKGLIYEYLRGQRDIDTKLEEIYNAFIAE